LRFGDTWPHDLALWRGLLVSPDYVCPQYDADDSTVAWSSTPTIGSEQFIGLDAITGLFEYFTAQTFLNAFPPVQMSTRKDLHSLSRILDHEHPAVANDDGGCAHERRHSLKRNQCRQTDNDAAEAA
jgi:hypothetical protein